MWGKQQNPSPVGTIQRAAYRSRAIQLPEQQDRREGSVLIFLSREEERAGWEAMQMLCGKVTPPVSKGLRVQAGVGGRLPERKGSALETKPVVLAGRASPGSSMFILMTGAEINP